MSAEKRGKKGHLKLSSIKRGHVCEKRGQKEGIPIRTILVNKSPSQRSSARCSSTFLHMKLRARRSKEYIIILQLKNTLYYNYIFLLKSTDFFFAF
jgi:hypothetical protein